MPLSTPRWGLGREQERVRGLPPPARQAQQPARALSTHAAHARHPARKAQQGTGVRTEEGGARCQAGAYAAPLRGSMAGHDRRTRPPGVDPRTADGHEGPSRIPPHTPNRDSSAAAAAPPCFGYKKKKTPVLHERKFLFSGSWESYSSRQRRDGWVQHVGRGVGAVGMDVQHMQRAHNHDRGDLQRLQRSSTPECRICAQRRHRQLVQHVGWGLGREQERVRGLPPSCAIQ